MDFYQQPLQQHYQYSRCECHDCTQARWKMSTQGQIAGLAGLGQSTGLGSASQLDMQAQREAAKQQLQGGTAR